MQDLHFDFPSDPESNTNKHHQNTGIMLILQHISSYKNSKIKHHLFHTRDCTVLLTSTPLSTSASSTGRPKLLHNWSFSELSLFIISFNWNNSVGYREKNINLCRKQTRENVETFRVSGDLDLQQILYGRCCCCYAQRDGWEASLVEAEVVCILHLRGVKNAASRD